MIRNDDTKTIHRTFCLICIALSMFSGRLLADSENNARIAIVAGKASGLNESPLVSLLEVKLLEVAGVELLERQEIKKRERAAVPKSTIRGNS